MKVSAAQMHEITPGDYTVVVKASNFVGEITGTMNLHVDEHPCYFTYIRYGNNLGLDETTEASQFRFHSLSEIQSMGTIAPKTDFNPDGGATLTWSSEAKFQSAGISIDRNTGVLTLGTTEANFAREMPIIFVTATATLDDFSYSHVVPVFFHYAKEVNGITLEYTPFVFRTSPRLGGRSSVPVLGGADASNFLIDYRRSPQYWNLNGERSDGTPHESGAIADNQFLTNLWTTYGAGTGSKDPMGFFRGTDIDRSNLSRKLGYVDNTSGSSNKYSVVVNPNLWNDDGWADGVFMMTMTFTVDGSINNVNGGTEIRPIAIWLDKSLN